jgi:hypothetical protein
MRLRLHTLVPLLLIAEWGCAAKPYQASFNSPLLQPREAPEVAKNGVAIAVDPITRENLQQFPDVARIATWREPDPGAAHPIGMGSGISSTSQLQMVPRSALISFVPLPAFRVRIANGSSRPVSFGSGQVQLEDNLHRQYAPILDSLTIRGRFIRDMTGTNTHIANDQSMMRSFINIIDELPILNPSVVIAPGGSWMGYAVFETGAIGGDEYNAWMNSVQSFDLRLRGSASPGENGPEFTFNLDKQNKVVSLTCPADAKTPSLEKCSRPDDPSTIRSGITRPEGQR